MCFVQTCSEICSVAVWVLIRSLQLSIHQCVCVCVRALTCARSANEHTCICESPLVCDVITSKFFSLVSATWWQDLTNVEAQLHTEVLQLCLEIFVPRWCQHSGIRPEEGCITQEMEHLCFWRATRETPTGLGGEMRFGASHFKKVSQFALNQMEATASCCTV